MFVAMQQKRHDADYNPEERFYKSAVLADIAAAKVVIEGFENAQPKHKRAFAAHIIAKVRR